MPLNLEKPLWISFDNYGLPPKKVVEYAILPSGRIVVMTDEESFWFESDGSSILGSYLFNNQIDFTI